MDLGSDRRGEYCRSRLLGSRENTASGSAGTCRNACTNGNARS